MERTHAWTRPKRVRLAWGSLALGAAGLVATAVMPDRLAAQDFDWSGAIAQGRTIEIKGVNGGITAVPAPGERVEVVADKTGRRSDEDEVEIQVVEHADGVTICAVYPSRPGRRPNECAPGEDGRMNVHDNDVEVAFTVRVPAGVRLVARTVNGDVDAEGLQSDVVARTVNGDVEVSTSRIAEAKTVNGSIRAMLGRAEWVDRLDFETVNGEITLGLPADFDAEIRASTVNGGLTSDFPLRVEGRLTSRRIRATIGEGGRELNLSTVNGEIRLIRS